MPVINGVYTKDFPALGRAPIDADIIPIAEVANQITYKTTIGAIFNAKLSGTSGRLSKFTSANTLGNSILNEIGNAIHLTNGGLSYASFGIINPGTPGDPGVDNDCFIGSTINNDFTIRVNNTEVARFDTALRFKIANIPNADTDTDKFLVSDAGVVKYRTGAEVLSDIGGASASGYVPYTGATTNVDLGTNELSGKYLVANGAAALGGVLSIKQDAAYLAKGNGYSSIASSNIMFDFFGYTGASTYKNFALKFNGLTDNTRREYTLPNSDGTIALTSDIPSLTDYVTLDTNQTITGEKTFTASRTIFQNSDGAQITFKNTSDLTKTLNIGYGSNGNIFSSNGLDFRVGGLTSSALLITANENATFKENLTAKSFIKSGGTSSQFLKADGSVDSTAYQGAITLTTTGSSGASTLIGNTLNIPNYSPDLSGYVTLNTAQTITAAKTFTTSGGDNTLVINHSSGSGIGLSITKGGNGEGIYVNKTSGSGNAVTIVGTLNATTLVKNGGTSSQFLKADGSVDSTAYGTGSVTSIGLSSSTSGVIISLSPVTTSGTINLSISTASGSQQGLLSSTDWTTFNSKQAPITLTTTGTSGAATFSSNTLNIPNYTVLSLAAIGISPNANGASIVGSLLSLQPASASFGGVVTTGAQTFAGDKTLTGALNGTSASFSSSVTAGAAINLPNNFSLTGRNAANTLNIALIARNSLDRVIIDADGYGTNIGGGGTVLINPSAGNVGIGTTSPAQKLDVVGKFRVTDDIILAQTNGRIDYDNGVTGALRFYSTSTATERMRITSGGNVGIGTDIPRAKLDVNGDALINDLTVGRGAGNISTNTALGLNALDANTTGTFNTAVGKDALLSNTTGSSNTAIGLNALDGNTTGSSNTAIGLNALLSNTTASDNTAVGYLALQYNTTGESNVAVGTSALRDNTTGLDNTAVGPAAGLQLTTGSNNTLLGHNAGRGASPSGSITTGSNIVVLGDNNVTDLYCADTTISSSDARDKTDVSDFTYGLDWVTQLRPVTYRWDKRSWYVDKDATTEDLLNAQPDGSKKRSKLHVGFLAQEELEVEKQFGFGESKDDMLIANLNEDESAYGIKYERLVPVLVNAIKELNGLVQAQQAQIEELKALINK
jgi:hypothetical protein